MSNSKKLDGGSRGVNFYWTDIEEEEKKSEKVEQEKPRLKGLNVVGKIDLEKKKAEEAEAAEEKKPVNVFDIDMFLKADSDELSGQTRYRTKTGVPVPIANSVRLATVRIKPIYKDDPNYTTGPGTFWSYSNKQYLDCDIELNRMSKSQLRTFPNCCGVLTLSNVYPLFTLNMTFLESFFEYCSRFYTAIEFYNNTNSEVGLYSPKDIKGLSIEDIGENPKSGNILYRFNLDLSVYRKKEKL